MVEICQSAHKGTAGGSVKRHLRDVNGPLRFTVPLNVLKAGSAEAFEHRVGVKLCGSASSRGAPVEAQEATKTVPTGSVQTKSRTYEAAGLISASALGDRTARRAM